MLTQIYVKNFILIDEISLDLREHMSAFTGETGAGKSLLMDAIAILKGDRVSSSMVKEGCAKAIVEGVFTMAKEHPANAILQEAGFDIEDDSFIVTREITKEGKSVARINHRTTTLSFLKEVVSTLVDLHSQHDTQYLLQPKSHLHLLDTFAHHDDFVNAVKTTWKAYKQVADAMEAALHHDYNEEDLEFLTFQLNEIQDAAIAEGEVEELEEEQKRMMAFEKLKEHSQNALQLLEDGSIQHIYEAYRQLSSVHEDSFLEEAAQRLLDAYYQLDEECSSIRSHVEAMEFDEEHFHEMQERIFLIHKIVRKYGGSVAAVKEKQTALETRIDSILHRQDYLMKQQKELDKVKKSYDAACMKLHESRVQKAKELEALIVTQLHDLQLEHARFHVSIETKEGSASGKDKVVFLVAMNSGERLKNLSATASGGELSRFMLGLKTIFTRLQGIETIIFDEIDTGVSGSVAFSIGRKMQELARDCQLFCVTHLASVAACANQQYVVEKSQEKGRTRTMIHELDTAQRIQELAVISSGSASATALKAAEELYEKAQKNIRK